MENSSSNKITESIGKLREGEKGLNSITINPNICLELNIMRMLENRNGNFPITINKTTTTENRVVGTDRKRQFSKHVLQNK